MWTPITTVEQLVAIFEKSDLDLKRRYDLSLAKTPYDIAKDVAAFASAAGGTIVVGAEESDGRISALPGVADVPDLVRESGRAVQTFCSPWPLYEEKVLALSRPDCARVLPGFSSASAPIHLVVVNVGPDVRGPIGVRPKNDKGNPIQNSYGFPVRVGEQTDWLRPEQLPMWMNSHERRIAIRLRAIPSGETIRAFHVQRLHEDEWLTLFLDRVDEAQAIAVFTQSGRGASTHVPLAFVRAVWREAVLGVWSIKVAGTLYPISQGMTFIPQHD
jgi:hypothetical protein